MCLVFFFFCQLTLETSRPLCVFNARTSWRWCNRSCLFKGRRDGVIHPRASTRHAVHAVTVITKWRVEEGSLLASS